MSISNAYGFYGFKARIECVVIVDVTIRTNNNQLNISNINTVNVYDIKKNRIL